MDIIGMKNISDITGKWKIIHIIIYSMYGLELNYNLIYILRRQLYETFYIRQIICRLIIICDQQ